MIWETLYHKGTSTTSGFRPKMFSSHMYHSHHNSKAPKFDSDYVMVLNDANLGFVITGNPPSRYP